MIVPDDDRLPAAPLLLADGARNLLQVALGAAGSIAELTPRMVLYRPRRRMVVGYGAFVDWPDGRRTTETFVAVTGVKGPPPGAAVLESDGLVVGVWRFPHDPLLPGLPAAADAARVRRLLDDIGGGPGDVTLATLSYRPERRAVVRADTPDDRLYLKVVRPERVATLHRAHRVLADRVRVPRSYGRSDDLGLVALDALGGTTLSQRLLGEGTLPSPAALLEVLDRIADAPLEGAAREGPVAAAPFHAAVLRAVVPDVATRVDELLDAILAGPGDEKRRGVVHGDFYEAQVLVDDGGAVAGLLDVDGAAQGDRADDLATMVGHLEVLATVWAPTAERVRSYAAEVYDAFARSVPGIDIGRRVAAVVFGLATGAFQVQQPDWPHVTRERLDLAARWLGR